MAKDRKRPEKAGADGPAGRRAGRKARPKRMPSARTKTAMPFLAAEVADWIAANVARPADLPRTRPEYGIGDGLRFDLVNVIGYRCPMGLVPGATTGAPTCYAATWIPLSVDAKAEFIEWWDSQKDAKLAVDAVWGDTK